MIEKDYASNTYALCCAKCPTTVQDFNSWEEVIEYKKDKKNGWASRKENGEWIDLCSECLENWNNSAYASPIKKDNTKFDPVQTQKAQTWDTKGVAKEKNSINPTFYGWEILKGAQQMQLKLGQKIKLVVMDVESGIQSTGESFSYNGLTFISDITKEPIEKQMSILQFACEIFEYIV